MTNKRAATSFVSDAIDTMATPAAAAAAPIGALRVVTWNVLHPVHGLNWREMPMRSPAYNEETRCDAIMLVLRRFVESRYGNEVLVITLQEVSSEMSVRLISMCDKLGGIFSTAKVGDTKLKEGRAHTGYAQPDDDGQYELVLVFGLPKHTPTEWAPVELGAEHGGFKFARLVLPPPYSLALVSVHHAYGGARQRQINGLAAHLEALMLASPDLNAALVVGDCNCTAAALQAAYAAVPRSQPGLVLRARVHAAPAPTRVGKCAEPPNDLLGAECIDHAVVIGDWGSKWARDAAVARVHMTDVLALSDHRPVEFIFDAAAA